jgi:serine protease Do
MLQLTSSVRIRCSDILILSLSLIAGLGSAASAQDKPQRRDELVAVVERVKGSVVNIHSERTVQPDSANDPFRSAVMTPQRVNGMGTGIVLDPRGYIVTNYHVVDDVQSLRVHLSDGTRLAARVIAAEKDTDLAVIKIDPPRSLSMAPLGTSQDLMLAERVIAIGNAFGYEHSVTVGHISAMKRDVTLNKEISYKSLIQTQTPINPGNSGGPLFNKLGEVVGVNVAIHAKAQNIAFAIPVDQMIVRAADMMSIRRRMGLRHGMIVADNYQRVAEDTNLKRWVSVSRVEPDSPAAEAGIRSGDIIEKVNDITLATSVDLERSLLESATKGIPVKVRRGSESVDATLNLVSANQVGTSTAQTDLIWRRLGVKLVPVAADAVTRIDRQLRGGMVIQEVTNNSSLVRGGLQRGDILIGLHLWEAINVTNIEFVLNHKELSTFNPMKAYFIREGRIREAVVSLPTE